MKIINGWPCKKIKTAMGHILWVRMTEDEILEREIYRLLVVATPLLMIWAWAWAAGIFK